MCYGSGCPFEKRTGYNDTICTKSEWDKCPLDCETDTEFDDWYDSKWDWWDYNEDRCMEEYFERKYAKGDNE